MRRELQEKLFNDFPLLYGDKNKSMQETCMCWGIDCGDGWYDLIYDLSSKLEKHIEQFMKDYPDSDCSRCGCDKKEHLGCKTLNVGKCLNVLKIQTRFANCKWGNWKFKYQYWYYFLKQKIFNIVNFFLGLVFYKYHTCHCEKYEPYCPRALQVKEKYGTLRFYMTCVTDEMLQLIDEAEEKSEITCEHCGQPGRLRDTGWSVTECDKCNQR